MSDTFTTFLQEPEPKDREQSLEVYVKARLQSIDRAVGGYTSVSLQGLSGNVDLTPTQAKHRRIKLTGNPAAAVTVRIPHATGANADIHFVNACGGSFSTITVKSTGANVGNAAGVSLLAGLTQLVQHDGESAYPAALAVGAGSEAWTSYTPTVTPFSGSITTLGARAGRYKLMGKTCFFSFSVTIATNGTAAGFLNVSLPFTAGPMPYAAHGLEGGVTGRALRAQISAGSSTALVTDYTNAYPGGNGHLILITGFYEVA